MRPWLLPGGLLLVTLGALAALVVVDRAGGPVADRSWIGLVGVAAFLLLVLSLLSQHQRRSSWLALLVARDGALRRGGKGEGADPARRRAVPVIVLGGQAAVVERLGRYSRVLTPGQHALAPGESITHVVNTTTRSLAGTLEAATKDGVPVAVEFQLEARVLTEHLPVAPRPLVPGRAVLPDSLPAHAEEPSLDAVVRAAYQVPSWELAALSAARNALRDSLARTYLDEIYDVAAVGKDSYPFAALADQARARLDDETRAWGVTVRRVRLSRIKLPPEVVSTAIEAWRGRQEAALDAINAAAPAPLISDIQAQDGTQPSAKIRLLPIVGRGQATSLREALRQRLGYVVATSLEVRGRPHHLQAVGSGSAGELSLLPDSVLFALQVGPGGVAGTPASPGDYLLFEQNDTVLDGRILAGADDGKFFLGAASRRPGHFFVQPDGEGEPPLLLAETEGDLRTAMTLYGSGHVAVRARLLRDVRILGHAVLLLRAANPSGEPDVPGPDPCAAPIRHAVAGPNETLDSAIERGDLAPDQGGSHHE